MGDPIGFAVIYRWRLKPGTEEEFRAAWGAVTRSIRRERGGLGSRLHRADDGTWVAYAQWPSRDAWEASRRSGPVDAARQAAMTAAIAESFEPMLLQPVADLLARDAAPDDGCRCD